MMNYEHLAEIASDELRELRAQRDALRQALEAIRDNVRMAMRLVEHPAKDPLAWLDSAARRCDAALNSPDQD